MFLSGKASPSEIEAMNYHQLEYWSSLVRIQIEADKKLADEIRKANNR